ncbi:hypothetical protein LIMU106485_10265 [Limosilactobacillus mucosae]
MCNYYFNDRYENHMELLEIDHPKRLVLKA